MVDFQHILRGEHRQNLLHPGPWGGGDMNPGEETGALKMRAECGTYQTSAGLVITAFGAGDFRTRTILQQSLKAGAALTTL